MRTSLASAAFTILCVAAPLDCLADDLTIQLADPKFSVSIPGQRPAQFAPHPAAAANPAAKLMGNTSDGMTVSALAQEAKGANAQQCASWLTGSTLSRYAPDLASVQILPAGSNAWVLVYTFKAGPLEQLKAHVFSGNGKGHCLEIHMSRTNPSDAQRQAWAAGFRGITVSAD